MQHGWSSTSNSYDSNVWWKFHRQRSQFEQTVNVYCHWFIFNYMLFYKQRFFSSQLQCCLTFYWTEPEMLLNCFPITYRHYLALTRYIIIFIIINHIISLKQTHLCFLEYSRQKYSLRVLLSFCTIFCQFQDGVAYKKVCSTAIHLNFHGTYCISSLNSFPSFLFGYF